MNTESKEQSKSNEIEKNEKDFPIVQLEVEIPQITFDKKKDTRRNYNKKSNHWGLLDKLKKIKNKNNTEKMIPNKKSDEIIIDKKKKITVVRENEKKKEDKNTIIKHDVINPLESETENETENEEEPQKKEIESSSSEESTIIPIKRKRDNIRHDKRNRHHSRKIQKVRFL
jgi:hypothetical protein